MTGMILGQKGAEAFERRGIGAETVARFNVYTGKHSNDGIVPSEDGNIIVFPFIEDGVVVNEKFRGPGKKFWQRSGGKKTFWNADALDDPALADGKYPLVITEGEIDALTAIDCGWPLTVSVPDGAPPAKEDKSTDDRPIDDSQGKYEFLWNNRHRMKPIKQFIIAVDNDAPGQRLAEELVRRLSASRCRFVTYPEGCKDLNEVLMRYGKNRVGDVLNDAKPYPVKGLFTLSQYPEHEKVKTFSTGWETLDNHFKLFFPMFAVVTGIPGNGKTSWMTQLMIQMAELHGWRTAVFSPEMPVVPFLRDKMRRIVGRDTVETLRGQNRLAEIDQWLNESIVFLDHRGQDDEDLTLDWIIDRAEDAVARYGIRMLVVDPWNDVEHAKRRDETMTEYVNRGIRSLKRLAVKHNLAVFVLAHPTKDVGKDGGKRTPSLYDISDSAAWANKPDFGIVVDRPDPMIPQTAVYITKVRFEETGTVGKVIFSFDQWTSRYGLLDGCK